MITVLPPGRFGERPPGQSSSLRQSGTDLSGSPSFVMHERGLQHDWSGVGLLSLKSFVQGEAWYRADGGRYRLDRRSYLILNHAQPYHIEIEAEREVESFCLFFEAGFAEQVFQSLTAANDYQLTAPDRRSTAFSQKGVEFADQPHLIANMETYDLWMAFFRDPEGNLLGLMSEVAHG